MGEFSHVSVLLRESIEGLNIKPDGIYVDGTTGGGGHSLEIAKRLKTGRLICIDRDCDALKAAKERLKDFSNITFVHDNYKNLKSILCDLNIEKVDGMLFDLGVSSYQLDEKQRGFSYMEVDAPLDMRMDRSESFSAKDIVNTYEERDLSWIFKEYGEEKFAKRIASNIVKKRAKKPFETTGDLVDLILESTPKNQPGGHPAKRVFQALRIELNEELKDLDLFVKDLQDLCNTKGRICFITFHSLEDRIIKQGFKKLADPCECPKSFPVCICGKTPFGKIITTKPIVPDKEEIETNSRAKSAKLRIFESY